MRFLLMIALLTLLAGSALAQGAGEDMIGLFFDFPCDGYNTNHVSTGAPFDAYIALLNPSVDSVGGYELKITFDPADIFVLGADGPNNWTNFGDNLNHLVGYGVPLPVEGDCVHLATVHLLYTGVDMVNIHFGPSEPSSIPGFPVISDGANPDILIACPCTTADCIVATINGDPVSTEQRSWSSLKSLFD